MKDNSLDKNYIAVTQAVGHLSTKFQNLAFPIKHSYFYDLIGENENNLFKIKIVHSNYKNIGGEYVVNLRKCGKNANGKASFQAFDPNTCDYVYVHTAENCFFIPSHEINAKRAITLSVFQQFKILIPS